MSRALFLGLVPLALVGLDCTRAGAPAAGERVGSIEVSSERAGAEIWIEGARTPFLTPHDVPELPVGAEIEVSVALPGHVADPPKRIVVLAPEAPSAKVHFVLRPGRSFRLTSDPPGAKVELDGEKVGTTPLQLPPLELGRSATLALSLDGYLEEKRLLRVTPGAKEIETVRLYRVGSVEVMSEPAGARVSVGGELRGRTPLLGLEVEPGKPFELVVERAGYAPHRGKYQADPAARNRIDVALDRLPIATLPVTPSEKHALAVLDTAVAQATKELGRLEKDIADAEKRGARAKVESLKRALEHAKEERFDAYNAREAVWEAVVSRLEAKAEEREKGSGAGR